jgi:hypothetical protein
MELSRARLESAFAKILAKNRDSDPLTLAEKLVERLEWIMDDVEVATDIKPVKIVDWEEDVKQEVAETPKPAKARVKPLKQEGGVRPPPLPEKSMILTPDDPEFQKAAKEAGQSRPSRSVARVSNIGHGGTEPSKSVEFWTVETLIKALSDNTPAEFFFVPNGMDDSLKVKAVRNIQPIIMTQGPSIVRLEYANPGVSQDRSTTNTAGQLDEVVLGLIASDTFTLDMTDLNIEAAMDKIEGQLKGLYAPRSSSSEPMGRDPGPIEQMFNMNDPKRRTPMGESYDIHGESGWRNTNPNSVVASIIATNKKYGNR